MHLLSLLQQLRHQLQPLLPAVPNRVSSPKKILDVGNCVPDHNAIRRMLESKFAAQVLQTHGPDDTLELLKREKVDLVLINRKLDQDYSDGIEILKQIKGIPELAAIPVMIVTNYEEHQLASIQAGGIRGFGKLELNKPETHQRIEAVLQGKS